MMKNKKKYISLLLIAVLLTSLCLPVFADSGSIGFSDVAADAWYASSVNYAKEHGLMNGTSATTFSPNETMTRAMLAAVLHRMAGSPAVQGENSFSDTMEGTWYADAVLWASQQGLIGGYRNGLFGTNDPVSREQIATILWRLTGSPVVENGFNFADERAIASYASEAVDWARANGVINGMEGNIFAPKKNATRAQVAAILVNYVQKEFHSFDENTNENDDKDVNILVAYFTVPETSGVDAVAQASRVVENGEVVGNVEFIARTIQEETGADLFAIETVQAYPGTHAELLDFAAAEMEVNARPELATQLDNLDQYDVIFLGYPIWNADLPMPVYSFLDNYNLAGKTVIPFSAHGGSGFAGTISTIASEEPRANVERNGFTVSRNSVSEAKNDIIDWLRELGYTQAQQLTTTPAPSSANNDILIAYFSHTGTTKEVAEHIQQQIGGDLFRIEPAEPYENGYASADRAQQEVENDARPMLANQVETMEQYDTIFIGYPIWYHNAPMVIATFLESYDLSGKTVIPFCTSSSSDIAESMDLIYRLCNDATVLDGLTANGSHESIDRWLSSTMEQLSQ